MIGKTLAHYKITRLLGKGGMGEVYAAEDTRLQREVALKILSPALADQPDRRARFEREALAVAALNHPNIVTIHSVDDAEGTPFLTMELVEGPLLSDEVPAGGLSAERFLEIALPLTDALATAHDKGITHRDIKPANVMFDGAGRVKVLDFGLAKLLETETGPSAATMATAPAHETAEGSVLGTAYYMAPEQAEGRGVDARSDVFSLGVLFYEMLTGTRPFEGDTSISVISSILKDEPSSVHEVKPVLPRHLGRIVTRCLAKDPERRYQSAKELRNELESLKAEMDSGEHSGEHRVPASAITAAPSGAAGLASDAGRAGAAAVSALSSTDGSEVSGVSVITGAAAEGSGRRGMLIGIAVAAVALVAVLVTLQFTGSDAGLAGSGSTGAVGVIGFENLSDPGDPEQLGRMLTGLVTTYLAESGGVEVVSMSTVLASRNAVSGKAEYDAAQAAATAKRAGAGVMVLGQISRLGDRIGVTAELVDVEKGTARGSMHYQLASTDEFFDIAGRMAEEIRAKLGPTESASPTGETLRLDTALTSSPEAYRHYVAGETALHQRRWADSVRHLDLALAEDPTFALAYYRKAMAIWWDGDYTTAIEVLDAGQPHVDRLPDRWRSMYAGLRHHLLGEDDTSLRILQDLVATNNDLPDAWYMLGEIYTHSSKHLDTERARECFQTALDIDPNFSVVLFHLVSFMLASGDFDEAKAVLDHFRDVGQNDASYVTMEMAYLTTVGRVDEAIVVGERARAAGLTETAGRLVFAYVLTGRLDEALALREESLASAVGFNRGLTSTSTGILIAFSGRIEDGISLYREGCALMSESDAGNVLGTHRSTMADLLLFLDRDDEALAWARETVGMVPDLPATHLALIRALVQTGGLEQAREAMQRMETETAGSRDIRAARYLANARAEIALAAGDPDSALRILSANSEFDSFLRWSLLLESRVLSAKGDYAGAADRIAESMKPEYIGGFGNLLHLGMAPWYLARAYDQAGDTPKAREAYRDFLAIWRDAGESFPKRGLAVERLAVLERAN